MERSAMRPTRLRLDSFPPRRHNTPAADGLRKDASMTESVRSIWVSRILATILILGTAAARIAYLGWFTAFDLAADEAHYWDWSRNLDWSYYSKGPLVALLIRASCTLF